MPQVGEGTLTSGCSQHEDVLSPGAYEDSYRSINCKPHSVPFPMHRLTQQPGRMRNLLPPFSRKKKYFFKPSYKAIDIVKNSTVQKCIKLQTKTLLPS